MTWREKAACLDSDPDIFFVDRGHPITKARRICRDCPVQQECLDYAVTTDQNFGVWGGLRARERREL